MISAIFRYPHTVADDEIDQQGHANNVAFVGWMQAAAIAHSAALGWTAERYGQMGMGWVARRHTIDYLQPAYAGEELIVETQVADMKKVTSTRVYRILRRSDGDRFGQGGDELGVHQLRDRQADADSGGDCRGVPGYFFNSNVTLTPARIESLPRAIVSETSPELPRMSWATFCDIPPFRPDPQPPHQLE